MASLLDSWGSRQQIGVPCGSRYGDVGQVAKELHKQAPQPAIRRVGMESLMPEEPYVVRRELQGRVQKPLR
jgi:hypothetical protein